MFGLFSNKNLYNITTALMTRPSKAEVSAPEAPEAPEAPAPPAPPIKSIDYFDDPIEHYYSRQMKFIAEVNARLEKERVEQRKIFKEGDFVRHKTGGPVMMVVEIFDSSKDKGNRENEHILCRHVSDTGIHDRWMGNNEVVLSTKPAT